MLRPTSAVSSFILLYTKVVSTWAGRYAAFRAAFWAEFSFEGVNSDSDLLYIDIERDCADSERTTRNESGKVSVDGGGDV